MREEWGLRAKAGSCDLILSRNEKALGVMRRDWHDSCSKANTQTAMWRLTKSTQGGSRDQSGGQGRRTRGQQWDTYQVPGPAWDTDWDIETRKTGSLSSRRN